jgi:hypothetical protein
MKNFKLSRLSQAIRAGVAAALAVVAGSTAAQQVSAPHAIFHVDCYEAKPGMTAHVASMQEQIAKFKERGELDKAESFHQDMMARFMQPKWSLQEHNLVTTAGLTDILDKYFKGSSYTATWFCGLISSVSYSTIVVGDTMASHAGWTEAGGTNAPTYTGNRPALTFGTASAGSLATSSASSFTFGSTGTIKGMFANSVTTKDGTTGTLYNAVLFTGGDRAVVSTDVVNVSVTYTAT